MKIGSLGKVVFEVGADKVRTFDNAQWSSSANISSHKRHLNSALAEFTGYDADTVSLDLRVSKYLGCNPEEDIKTLSEYEKTGKAVKLIVGKKVCGNYKWLIKSLKVSARLYDKSGALTDADIAVSLIEYAKE